MKFEFKKSKYPIFAIVFWILILFSLYSVFSVFFVFVTHFTGKNLNFGNFQAILWEFLIPNANTR